MLEYIVLGIIQGIAEWLPVSSEGLIVLAKTHFFPSAGGFNETIEIALFLHLGTVLAAVIYFRRDILTLLKALPQLARNTAREEDRKLLSFLIVSTILSGALGLTLLKTLAHLFEDNATPAAAINILVGACLLITGTLELRAGQKGTRTDRDLKPVDGIILGIAQGFAALPGLSRSGLTVSALLLRQFEKTVALRLSFLMSILIVLAGNVILNADKGVISPASLTGLLLSFAFGLATIHALLIMARKINFGWFVIVFGILTLISVFV